MGGMGGMGHMGGMGMGHMGGIGGGVGSFHHGGHGGFHHGGFGGFGYGGFYPGFYGLGLGYGYGLGGLGLGYGGYGLGYGLGYGYGGYGLGYGGYGLGYGGYGLGGLGYSSYYPYYNYNYPGYTYGAGDPYYSSYLYGGGVSGAPATGSTFTYSSAYGPTTYPLPNLGIDESSVAVGNGRGIRVERVQAGSPAEAAGLQAGDVIRSANGYLTQDPGNLSWIISHHAQDNTLNLVVRKAGAENDSTVVVKLK
jgi:hypothetical protein